MNKQIDGSTLAVLNCYRNKYYTDGNNTEQGLVANAINEVLPTLVELKNGGYRKSTDVAREIFEEIEKLIIRRMIEDTPRIDDRLITDIAELKKKYESEGADDENCV